MKMMRCRICGETYLGTETPSRCPFCGAAAEYFVEGPDGFSSEENRVQVTEVERADLQQAIELERSNARYYAAMALNQGNESLASAYKRLSRIEAEHCSLFCKLADERKPLDLAEPEGASGDWCTDIIESLKREQTAASFYAEAAARSTDSRIREVFSAVSDIERDHIEFDGVASVAAGC